MQRCAASTCLKDIACDDSVSPDGHFAMHAVFRHREEGKNKKLPPCVQGSSDTSA